MKRLFFVLLCILGCSVAGRAQGVSLQQYFANNVGRPLAGVSVRVCNHVSGPPATPCATTLSTLYNNIELSGSPIANPTVTDALGNLLVYVVAGDYDYTVSGNGITTKTYTISAGGSGGGGGAPTTDTYVTSGVEAGLPNSRQLTAGTNVSLSTATPGEIIVSAAQGGSATPGQGVCYADPGGSDSNDGLSFATPKQTVYGAITSCLPDGSTSTHIAGHGTVYTTGASINAGGDIGGIMVLGSADPHWSNTLSSAARVANVVTLTFGSAHHYTTGQYITVYGTTGGTTSFNGNFTVASTPLATTLTFAQTGANESATGATGQVIPEGFLREGSAGFNLFGLGWDGVQLGTIGNVTVIEGESSTAPAHRHGTIQLAGTGRNYNFQQVFFEGGVGCMIAIDSNGDVTNSVGGGNVAANNWGCGTKFQATVSNGPAFQLGGLSIFNNFQNTYINANGQGFSTISAIARASNVVSVTLVAGQAGFTVGQEVEILNVSDSSFDGLFTLTTVTDQQHLVWAQTGMDATSSAGSLNLSANNINLCGIDYPGYGGNTEGRFSGRLVLNGGGVCTNTLNPVGSGSSILLENPVMQLSGSPTTTPPLYRCWIGGAGTCPNALITNPNVSDPGLNPPIIKVPAGETSETTRVDCGPGTQTYITFDGPMTISRNCKTDQMNAMNSTVQNSSALGKGETGSVNGRTIDQVDDTRRNQAPVYTKFTNLADNVCADWVNVTGGSLTVTCGVTDMTHIATGAGNLTKTTGGDGYVTVYDANRTVLNGDYFLFGAWVRASSTAGVAQSYFQDAPVRLYYPGTFPNNLGSAGVGNCGEGSGLGRIAMDGFLSSQEDGQWQWVWCWDRILDPITASMHEIQLQLHAQNLYPLDFYAPVFIHVPISTLSRSTSTVMGVVRALNITTVTTTATHHFLPYQAVCLSGVTDTTFNICGTVLPQPVPTGTTFAISNAGSAGSSSMGTIYAVADSEAAELALAMSSYPATAGTGQLWDMTGQVPHVNVAQTWTGTQSFATVNATSIPVPGPIGGTTPAAGHFTTLGTTGVVSPVDNITAAANTPGVPVLVGWASQNAKTTAQTAATLFATSATTMYRFSGSVQCTTTSAAATVSVSVLYTDTSGTVQTITSTAAACTALGASSDVGTVLAFEAKTGTNIQYQTTIVNTPTYDVRVSVEQLGTN